MKNTSLYLVRHAQSVSNVRVEQGLDHSPRTEFGSDLSELGETQAEELAQQLSNIHFDALYSSHLTRAEKTARAIARKKNLTVTIVRDLKERDHEIEDEIATTNRFASAVKDIVKKHPGQTILIVAHGFVIRTFLMHVGHKGSAELVSGDIENTGYIKFEVNEEKFAVVSSKGVKNYGVHIRPYEDKDFHSIISLMTTLQEYFVDLDQSQEKKTFTTQKEAEEYILQTLKDVKEMDGATFVAEQDEHVIGFVQGVVKHHENDVMHILTHQKSIDGWIGLLFVEASLRSQGIGQLLINKMRDFFKEKNCTTMRLFVAHNNQRTIDAYEKYGFIPTELEMAIKIYD